MSSPEYPAPFVVAGDIFTATTYFDGADGAMVRIVPPFEGAAVLEANEGHGIRARHFATTPEATVLELNPTDGSNISRETAMHIVGGIVLDLDRADGGTGPWKMPADVERYTPEQANGQFYGPRDL